MLDRRPMGTLATNEATAKAAEDADLAGSGYTKLGRTGLTVSRLGFGSYRLDGEPPGQSEALARALLSGVNLIDTASNYTDGRAERTIGAVLKRLFAEGKLRRQAVVVVGKAGFAQGEALAKLREAEAAGEPTPEVVHWQEQVWYSLHPTFLQQELEGSLQRLGLDALDLFLVHNPETFLVDAKRSRPKAAPALVHAQLQARLQRAFEWAEKQCDAGRLGGYGVSCNTLAGKPDALETLPLATVLASAEAAAKAVGRKASEHRLRAIQLPANLFEPAALVGSPSVVAEAAKAGLAVLVNRPLNGLRGDRVVRLADPPVLVPKAPFPEALEEVQALEAIFTQDFAPKIRVEGQGPRPEQLLRWGQELAQAPQQVQGLEAWAQLQQQRIGPEVNQVLQVLAQGFKSEPTFTAWAKRYAETLSRLLEAITSELLGKARAQSDKLKSDLHAHTPEAWKGASLSRIALGALLSEAHVTTVLVGMRRPAYVDDALGAVVLPPLTPEARTAVLGLFGRRGGAEADHKS